MQPEISRAIHGLLCDGSCNAADANRFDLGVLEALAQLAKVCRFRCGPLAKDEEVPLGFSDVRTTLQRRRPFS